MIFEPNSYGAVLLVFGLIWNSVLFLEMNILRVLTTRVQDCRSPSWLELSLYCPLHCKPSSSSTGAQPDRPTSEGGVGSFERQSNNVSINRGYRPNSLICVSYKRTKFDLNKPYCEASS